MAATWRPVVSLRGHTARTGAWWYAQRTHGHRHPAGAAPHRHARSLRCRCRRPDPCSCSARHLGSVHTCASDHHRRGRRLPTHLLTARAAPCVAVPDQIKPPSVLTRADEYALGTVRTGAEFTRQMGIDFARYKQTPPRWCMEGRPDIPYVPKIARQEAAQPQGRP